MDLGQYKLNSLIERVSGKFILEKLSIPFLIFCMLKVYFIHKSFSYFFKINYKLAPRFN